MDLRERAVAYVRGGGSQTEACKIFKINRKTLYGWLRLDDLAPQRVRGGFVRKLDREVVAAHVREHPDATLAERAAHFGVQINAIWYRLRQMKITQKKQQNIGRDARD